MKEFDLHAEEINSYLQNFEEIQDDFMLRLSKYGASFSNSVGMAQINMQSGNLLYNFRKIVNYIKVASSLKLKYIVFPELSLQGFPLEDSIGRHLCLGNKSYDYLNRIAEYAVNTTAIVGFLEPISNKIGKYYNSVAVLKDGKFECFVRKNYKNNSILFNDSLYIETHSSNNFISSKAYGKEFIEEDDYVKNLDFQIMIGDDVFLNKEANLNQLVNNSKLLFNLSSSVSFNTQKIENLRILSNLAKENNIPILRVTNVGANSGFSFDGCSSAYSSSGKLVGRSKMFEEQLVFVNLEENIGTVNSMPKGYLDNIKRESFSLDYSSDMERIYKTLVQGVRDYFKKCGLTRAVLGLSGGLDSTICAVILADAIGKKNVLGISMPSHITTKESMSDAECLAKNLGINFLEASIKPMIDVTTKCTNEIFNNVEKNWGKFWDNKNRIFTNTIDNKPVSFTPDNIQARARATYLWSVSNEFSSCIPIATSDKSELYMGYATINGDMSGGYAPIADVTKTQLFALARWMNENRTIKNVIPESIILKRPGAELAINPKTGKPLIAEDALMPYDFLDEIIWRVENKKESYDELLNSKFIYENDNNITKEQKIEWLDKFYRRMSTALYKWSILPPSIILQENTINKGIYSQPITSSRINYKN